MGALRDLSRILKVRIIISQRDKVKVLKGKVKVRGPKDQVRQKTRATLVVIQRGTGKAPLSQQHTGMLKGNWPQSIEESAFVSGTI